MNKRILFNYGTVEIVTGMVLKDARKRAGLSQVEMANHIGCHRHSIIAWESKIEPVSQRYPIPNAICNALGILKCREKNTSTRARGDRVLQFGDSIREEFERKLQAQLARITAKYQAKAAQKRMICGAKTRKGHSCKNKSVPGKQRCKFHGGMSTGPRTEAGRQVIRQAQKRRWAKWREEKQA